MHYIANFLRILIKPFLFSVESWLVFIMWIYLPKTGKNLNWAPYKVSANETVRSCHSCIDGEREQDHNGKAEAKGCWAKKGGGLLASRIANSLSLLRWIKLVTSPFI